MQVEEVTIEFRMVRADELPGAQTLVPVITDAQREAFAERMREWARNFEGLALGLSVDPGGQQWQAERAETLGAAPAEPAEQPAGTRTWRIERESAPGTRVWRFESGSTVSFSGSLPTPILGGEVRGRFGCGCDWCQAVARRTLPPLPSDEAARTALEGEILAYATPAEVAAVRAHLRAGKVYNTYGDCVIAIIAALRGETYHSVQLGPPVHLGLRTPVFERWLGELPRGATPESDETAAKLDAWLTDWLVRQGVPDDIEPAEPPPLPAHPTLQQILTARRYTFHPERGLTLRE